MSGANPNLNLPNSLSALGPLPPPNSPPPGQPAALEGQLKALLPKFHASYPMASLQSELLAIQADVYVVRACIFVGPSLMATGMAAAPHIEAAEDRARVRALELLTYPSPGTPRPVALSAPAPPPSASPARPARQPDAPALAPIPATLPHSEAPLPAPETVPHASPSSIGVPGPFAGDPPADHSTITPPPAAASISTDTSQAGPPPGLDHSPIPGLDSDPGPAPPPPTREVVPRQASQPAAPGRSPRKTSPTRGQPAPSGGTTDLSDIIAKTSVELTRLGWNEEQGREHLQRAYGKRSRQHLTDPELLDFLRYLEAQPTPPPHL